MEASPPPPHPPAGSQEPGALVLGKGITALGALRSLARAGRNAYLVGADEGFVLRSRHCRLLPAAGACAPREAQLPAFLEGLGAERMVLVPCSDGWASAVRALPPELRERFPASIAPREALHGLIDKGAFA